MIKGCFLFTLLLIAFKASVAQTITPPADPPFTTTLPANIKFNTPRDTTRDTTHKVMMRICAPSRAQILAHPVLYVIFSGSHEIQRGKSSDTTLLSSINPNDIQSIKVFNDKATVNKYGKVAQNGVVEIFMKDGKYPNGYQKPMQ